MADLRQNRKKSQPEEQFRPHSRYPRLNANAGASEAEPGSRVRRQARRRTVSTPGSDVPRPRIRLDSSVPASPGLGRMTRSTSSGKQLSIPSFAGRLPSLFALVALFGIAYWLLTSSTFHVSKIEVKGSRFLNSEEVVKLTGVDKSNIFLLNEDEVATKIRNLPYVLEAKVSKAIPDKLSVEVVERKSTLNWKIGSLSYLVDQDGVVLDSMLDKDVPADAQTFPVIQSLDERKLKLGDRVDAVAVRSAQTIQNELALAGIKIAAVQYSPANGLIVVSAPESGNWKALLGTDAQLEKKISILKGLLADKNIKWSYADLRFVNKPAIQ